MRYGQSPAVFMQCLGKLGREWREDWGYDDFPGSISMRTSVSISVAPTSNEGDSDYAEKSLQAKLVIHGPFPYIGRILIWPKFYKLLWVKRYQIKWLHVTRISHRSCLCMLLFPGPCKFGAKPEVAIASLHCIHSAGESTESLGPSLCCCSGVSRFYVGLQSVCLVTCPGSKKLQLSHSASLVWYCECGLLLRATQSGKSGCNPALETPPCLLLMSHEESLSWRDAAVICSPK